MFLCHTCTVCNVARVDQEMSQRAFYSIDEGILDDFNRLVPAPQRSKIVESLLLQHVSRTANAIEKAARMIEADPSYQSLHDNVQELAKETALRNFDE